MEPDRPKARPPAGTPQPQSNSTLRELVGLRSDVKKLGDRLIGIEKHLAPKPSATKLRAFLERSGQPLLIALIAGILGLLVLNGIAQLLQSRARPQYEFKVVSPDDADFERDVNAYGLTGWNIVTCRRATSGEGDDVKASYECILSKKV